MNRWITEAFVFGVAITEAAAGKSLSPSQGHPSLSSESKSDGNDVSNFYTVHFRYLDQCAEANLDMDSCLFLNFPAFMGLEGFSADENGDALLQGNCSPDVDEEHVRLVMTSVKLHCAVSGDLFTDKEFESAVDGFAKIYDSDGCFQQLCEDKSSSAGPFIEILFDEVAKCAGVELDINKSLLYQVIDMIYNRGDSDTNSDVERVRRRLSDSMDDQYPSSCEQLMPRYQAMERYLSSMIMFSEINCTATTHEVANVISYLATIFSTQHYWCGSCASDDDHDDRVPTPSRAPIQLPTPNPLVQQFGYIEVSFEVGVTLDGISMSDLDIAALDEVVYLLQNAFREMLLEEAIVRILSVGGFSVTHRLLRFLEEDHSGVEVEFDMTMMQMCSSAKCEDSEVDAISTSLREDATSNVKTKVKSGEIATSIQDKAKAFGFSELSGVTISASSLRVGEVKVTVKEAQDEEVPIDPHDGDENASFRRGYGVARSIVVGFFSVVFVIVLE
eukprot:CAMPEP_0201654700 /NCGR_PEP_ID=MMETSP0493-20130528/45631_1 /ASSEMBLY_ACC=CAM_ASM_000838 /TAXON_ID=420259 /ORGANISM="Thalassiosira gravida, Strain GMp14c1" /LENGTH=501 /DNA_ID=CAMNT_0048131267 /DNA_START=225 /DNA_END=1730 /DNA_ORIENTATION=+